MSYSSKLTKERILHFAKEEFLKKGFIDANLREIANNANVTTGALYNHYSNKEGLFDAIVGTFAAELLELFYKAHNDVPDHIDFSEHSKRDSMTNESFRVLSFIYDNFHLAYILFFQSNGTKYEYFKDKLIEIEETSSLETLEKENFEFNDVNRFFVHVMSTSGINNMLEVIHHNLCREDAFAYMQKIQRFYYAGVKEILGQ